MYRRGLALCLSFATASLAFADARINLVPTVPGPYLPGAVVTVNILLEQVNETNAAARLLRMVGLDFSDSPASLVIPNAGPVWSLGGLADCAGHPGTPCSAYYFDADLGAATFGPKTASMAYYFKNSNNLGANPAGQLTVPASGTVQVGTIEVTCPMLNGTYRLDVLNADETDVNRGSVVYWGFGIDQADPVRIYRPANTSPNDLLGGTLDLVVDDGGGGEDANLTGSSPPSCATTNGAGSSLWRSAGNFILLDFDADITLPGAGQIEINQLNAAGAFGPNLNSGAAFTFTLENNNRRLRIVDAGTSDLVHRNWYAIRNTGAWAGVEPFSVKLVVQVGDVSNDGRVLAADVSSINTCIPCANVNGGCTAVGCVEPFVRREMNGDNRILAVDVSIANASIPSANVNIPAGHTCP